MGCSSYYLSFVFFLMIRRPTSSTRTHTLFPYTTLFRSILGGLGASRSRDQGITALIVSLLSPSCFGHVSRLHHAYRTPAPDHLPLCAPLHCVPDWTRSAERRVGKAGVSTCSSRWSPDH